MTDGDPIVLDAGRFEALFPFHMVVDRDLRLRSHGRVLARIAVGVREGRALPDVFELVRPTRSFTFDGLTTPSGQLCILRHLESGMRLRGQFVPHGPLDADGHADALLFVGSPWISSADEMRSLGLTLADLPVHDATGDMLQLVQHQSIAMEDLKRLAARLDEQRRAMRESEERFRSLVQDLHVVVFRTDVDGRWLFLGRAWTELVGSDPETVIGTPMESFAVEEDRALVRDALEGLRSGALDVWRGVVRLAPAPGTCDVEERFVEILARRAPEDGSTIAGTLTDVSERVETERRTRRLGELQEITQRVIASFLADDDLGASIDRILRECGEFLDVSRAYLFRYRASVDRLWNTHEWCGAGVESQKHELQDLPGETFPWWLSRLRRGTPIVLTDVEAEAPDEVRAVLVDQGIRSMLVLPVLSQGELAGFIGFDETRRRRRWRQEEVALLQTMVESFSRAVERRIAERERVATAERLREAVDRAESANQLKSRFLANMSHELRTPMTAITGFSDLLTRPDGGEEERMDWAGAIRRNADHLLALLNDLLDVAKIEANQLNIDVSRFDAAEIVREVATHFETAAREKMLAFRTELPETPVMIRSDRVRLRQIVFNLVSNAIKYTEHGSVSVAIEVDPGDGTMRLRVADTGIGVAPEKADRLFEPFSRVHEPNESRASGVGLGLNICRQLSGLLGGELDFAPRPGGGTEFRLTLAIDGPAGAVDWEEDAVTDVDVRPTPASIAGLRVLLVEDGADNRKLLSHLLGQHGIEILEAVDGVEGVERMRAARAAGERIDLVLMDMQMPRMDGYAATRRLRDEGVATPIVALTAHAMATDRARCLEVGCDAYVSKPIDERQLLAEIAAATSREVDVAPTTSHDLDAAPGGATAASDADDASVPAWMRALRAEFTASLPTFRTTLRDAIRRGDRSGVTTVAHRLRGTAPSLGHAELGAVAGRCEDQLRADDGADPARCAAPLLATLDAAIADPDPALATGEASDRGPRASV